ncbi:NEDD8 activating enzyme [Aureococcus anophagefferens]|nr:NEDD8 activating enzyme [Aureococcus anophagefferens]
MYSNVDKLLTRPTSFGSETGSLAVGEFEASPEVRDFVTSECKVLVVGAGGLGCEILKDLALSGFADIHVIDMDTIDVPKATTAAAFINARCPKTTVTAHVGKVQEKDGDFYAQFNVVCSGLDNVEARRWLNSMLVSLAEVDDDGNVVDPSQIIPMVDGGTEGFRGQARVIIPRFTSCFECSLDSFPPQKTYPMCTIAETPRLPEHCISYAQLVEWPKAFPDKSVDTDSPEDMTWIFQVAEARARRKFDIEGVTYMKTMGVVKNIIPAVASTNAVVSAVCVNEVFKLMTLCSQSLNTYMMYMGNHGVYTHTFEYKKKDDCPITSARVRTLAVAPTMLLGTLIESMCGPDSDLRLKAPSLTTASQSLYMRKPKALEAATRANLGKPLSELVADDDEITVTDAIFPGDVSLTLKLSFECEEAA